MSTPNPYAADPFFTAVEQVPKDTSAGSCDLPILYRDASQLASFYRVDPAKAAAVLKGVGLEPLVMMGKTIVLLVGFEYRDTTVGVYNELGLGIMTKLPGTSISALKLIGDLAAQPQQGMFVANLPVTTEAARAAGFEIWGYPKYVTGIETSFDANGVRVVLQDEFEWSIGKQRGLRAKGLPLVTYTVREGHLVRTVVRVGNTVKWGGSRSVQLRLMGSGPTADNLRTLGLHEMRPSVSFRTDAMKSILPAGEDLGAIEWAGPAPEVAAAAGLDTGEGARAGDVGV